MKTQSIVMTWMPKTVVNYKKINMFYPENIKPPIFLVSYTISRLKYVTELIKKGSLYLPTQ